jgi:alpha-tubulin suppressor-like RCC1 family protein
MGDRFPGGVISKTPPTVVAPVDGEGGSASGVWTLAEQLGLEKAGAWPKRVLPRGLYAWGENSSRQLGDGTNANRSSPVQIGALTTWSKISAGGTHSLAIKRDGTLWAWGAGGQGRLGINDSPPYVSSPVQVGALTNWAQVSAAEGSAAITTGGQLYAWGNNGNGQVGDGTTNDKSSPVQIGSLTNWSRVSVSQDSCAAIKTDGTLWCWGFNNEGQLGQNNTISRSSPVQVGALSDWSQLDTGYRSVIAVKSNGTLWAFGANSGAREGQLGDGTIANRSSPVQIGALTGWAQAFGGNSFSAAVKTNGTLWVWGNGSSGKIGDGTTVDKSSPVQIGALTNWLQVSCGANFCGSVKTDGTLWSWGGNGSGQLGQNNTIPRSSPVQVGALTNWSQFSGSLTGTFSLAITKG